VEPLAPDSYAQFLAELKSRIQAAQLRASLAINRELVLLYWQIGRDIIDRQEREKRGTNVIDRLSSDLKRSFPKMKGFSPRNLKYMRAFAEAWPEEPIVQAELAQITWYHNVAILEKLASSEDRIWYAKQQFSMAGAGMSWCTRLKLDGCIGKAERSRISTAHFRYRSPTWHATLRKTLTISISSQTSMDRDPDRSPPRRSASRLATADLIKSDT
jgi:predicted nuclease of restriction endonuclease-like (RecB) superfamily